MDILPHGTHSPHAHSDHLAARFNRSMVIQTLTHFLKPGQVTELRVLDAETPSYRHPHIESGYFDNIEALADAVTRIRKAKGFYFIPNPIDPALLARAANRIRPAGKEPTTADHNIVQRHWLFIDVDPVRPAGISATDQEHAAAIERVMEIKGGLSQDGWPDPIVADSGNGAHILYRVHLPAEDQGLIECCLQAIAFRFGDTLVDIDQKVFNPARLLRLYGTVSAKGDHTPERPHRLARLIEVPATLHTVDTALLETLAATIPALPTMPAQKWETTNRSLFDIDHWIAEHGLGVRGPSPWQSGRKWVFTVCPWIPDHTNQSAYIVEMANGAIAAGCHHNSCSGKDWHALRDTVEPGWRTRLCNGTEAPQVIDSTSAPIGVWLDPQPLPNDLPPVMPFDYELLPRAVRPWIEDIARRVQCPPDFPAVAVMVALAGVVGRRIGIRPKRRDDWLVVPNLWGMVIGRPGIMKTPAIQEPLKPLKQLEIEAKEEYDQQKKEHEAAKLVAEEQGKLTKTKIKKALSSGQDANEIARSLVNEQVQLPIRKRYLVNDSTVEKLGELLNENPSGLLVYRDELIGFLRSLDKEGQEGARAFYLEAWNGSGRYTYDRIGRGTIDIEAATVSIIGAIQPGPLGGYLREAARNGRGDDGLLQRFQLTVWPDVSPNWINVDQWPDTGAKNEAYSAFARLDTLDPALIGAQTDPHDPDNIPYLRFDEEAQVAFDEWRAELERKVRSGDEHPAIESHLAKYRSLIPSLALLIHLADGGTGPIGLEAIERAIRWGDYLESHARRIYAVAINPNAAAARAIVKHILKGDLKDGFVLKDVYRPCWSGLSSRDDAAIGIDLLIDLDWLQETHEPTQGRTRTRYWINPKIWKSPSTPPAKTAQSQPRDLPAVKAVTPRGISEIKDDDQREVVEV